MAKNWKENYINKKFEHDRGEFDKELTLATRAYVIADSIAKGMSFRQIVSQYMKEWGVSYHYMQSVITESLNMFRNQEIFKQIKDINNERLNDIYKEAREKGDLDTAIKAIDKLNKANQVYDNPTTVAVSTDENNVVITFGGQTIDQVQASFNTKPEDVAYSEVDQIINNALDKKED